METELLIVKYIDILSGVMRQSMEEYREQPPYRELFRLTMTQLHYLHIIKLTGNSPPIANCSALP